MLKSQLSAALGVWLATSGIADAGPVDVTWLGHSTVRLEASYGRTIMIDPYLTLNPKTPAELRDLNRYADTDLILVTHGHVDHIDDLVPLAQLSGAPVIGPYELIRSLVKLGAIEGEQNVSLGKGGSVEPIGRGIRVHMVPAEHSSSIDLRAMEGEVEMTSPLRHVEGGEPVGFVIEFEDGPTIYHTGDTAVFGDMKLIGDFLSPDVVLACIGGVFTMDPKGAAYAVGELVGAPVTIPIHYGTFPFINRSPDEYAAELAQWPVTMIALEPGESYQAMP